MEVDLDVHLEIDSDVDLDVHLEVPEHLPSEGRKTVFCLSETYVFDVSRGLRKGPVLGRLNQP